MISKIEIDGYRLLDGFQADLRPLTVVIGANAVGKSSFLDALQLISQCLESPLNTAIGWHFGMNSIQNAAKTDGQIGWRVTFRKPAGSAWERLPLDDDKAYCYEVQLQTNAQGQAQAKYEVLRTTEPFAGYTDAFKYLEATNLRRQIYSREQRRLVPFDEAVPHPAQVREGETDKSTALTSTDAFASPAAQEPALLLSQMRFFNEFPIPSAARWLLASMAFFPGFDVTRWSNLRVKAAEIKPMTMLAATGENLGTVLHEVLTRYDYRQSATDIREFLQVAYPAFDAIHCDTTFGTPPQVLVRVREKGMRRSMELWELSDGMLRFLCLAAALLNPVPPSFIALDEPEVGLHPRLLPVIGDMIKTASERTQVLVSTHSSELLNRFGLEDIAVMTRGDGSASSWHRPADRKTLKAMLAEVTGESIGDLHRSGELEAMA